MTQHRAIARPNEVVCQGHCHHIAMVYNYASLHLSGGCAPWRGVVQVRNEQGLLSRTMRAQGPGRDQGPN
jgi:hypothetical protein